MLFLYNLLTLIAMPVLRLTAMFSPKMKLFTEGRKTVFETLCGKLSAADRTIWFHAASLGEYEQGLPVMEKLRKQYPEHKFVLTFFSPSGYEIRKNTKAADVVVYLPLDTKANAKRFVQIVKPEMTFFIKYEFWPNYLNELRKLGSTTYLISGIFRKDQAFFKWYGGFYREALQTFEHFFVQNENSKTLLQQIGFTNVTISGDTRFDRVSEVLERDNNLPFIEEFIDSKTTIVYGSSWPKDEAMFTDFINSSEGIKHIIAPHTIGPDHITDIKNSISKKTVLFSEKEGKNLADYDVFIIDTIGILGKIYSYADVAYVGGGFGTSGLHNILEPAAFSVPIVIGPNHQKFPEAAAMIQMGGCISASNEPELHKALSNLITNEDHRAEKGHMAGSFVSMNRGAVNIILNKINSGR
jgi:3-deoxy-D-manno-octulosonic-acid transferase